MNKYCIYSIGLILRSEKIIMNKIVLVLVLILRRAATRRGNKINR